MLFCRRQFLNLLGRSGDRMVERGSRNGNQRHPLCYINRTGAKAAAQFDCGHHTRAALDSSG